jgi:hypothetical protein
MWSKPQNGQECWKSLRIANTPELKFVDAKISVNFHAFRPFCIVTFWTRNVSSNANEICDVHCFMVDFEHGVDRVRRLSLSVDSQSMPNFRETISSFDGSLVRAWIARMDTMKRSTALSRCGQYLVLSASLGNQSWQQIIDLPTAKPTPPRCFPDQNNMRVIGSAMAYWHQHRYWTSIYRQRVLLNRSARNPEDRHTFSTLSCHVELTIVPGYLASAEAWVLIPESNGDAITLLLANKDGPAEAMTALVSWDVVTKQLDGLSAQYENRT